MYSILLGMVLFTGIILVLVSVVMLARRILLPSGFATVTVNGQQTLQVPQRGKLLLSLAENGIYLPAACGGKGSCGECRVKVLENAAAPMPTERAQLTRREIGAGYRLACALRVREDLQLQLPAELLEIRRHRCTVRSNRNVATFMKELVLSLPPDADFSFEAGEYVLLDAPPHQIRFVDFDIAPSFRGDWKAYGYLDLESCVEVPATRAYSLANYPGEGNIIMLVVRIALPPPKASPGTPPGQVSSYIFSLQPGDEVTVAGPFGDFCAKHSSREMVFIGGGAGIAPLRAIILDQLLGVGADRKISFWYGARSLKELCYRDDFDRLAARFTNFDWHVVLSEPRAEDAWEGYTGFVHDAVHDHYLAGHAAPEEAEYYICGPPVMSAAVINMLEDIGVDRDSIFLDDFGGG